VPPPLCYLLAWDTSLCAQVVRLFMRAVRRHLASVAKLAGVVSRLADAEFGAVCMVQRWGGSANLNVHLHALVADGVFVTDAAAQEARFVALPAPEKAAVSAVAWEVCERVVALLRKRGQWLDTPPEEDAFAEREPLLSRLYGASIAGTLVLGTKAGQRQVRLFGAAARSSEEDAGSKVRSAYGFDVHAGVRVAADDRAGLERLARYMTRPPLSQQRLAEQSDGRYRIALKTPWRDGTTHIVLEGPELVGRLAALVPPPRFHLTRYFGVWAPRAKLRTSVVPGYREEAPAACASKARRSPAEPMSELAQRRRMSWSKLLSRVFVVDVLECPRCASTLQRVQVCTTPSRIREVLGATGPPGNASAA
jgi:hypothetical protein